MSRIIHQTLTDLRWGRESWRVLLLLSLPALAAGIATGLIH
jgi:hypothetical protein